MSGIRNDVNCGEKREKRISVYSLIMKNMREVPKKKNYYYGLNVWSKQ